MKSGYDQFFQKAQRAAKGEPESGKRFALNPSQVEASLRQKAGVKKSRKKASVPWKMIVFSVVGFLVAGAGLVHADQLEDFLKRVEIGSFGQAFAQTPTPPAPTPPPAASAAPAAAERQPTSNQIDHLSKLSDRQRELEARAEELSRQEAELAQMKIELEKRLQELEGMRQQISEILAERVKVDEEKVETLVQMYSNMKPPQAAKIFESLDEDLAVELLSRMKKKNAADIMNLLPPEKAQIFSERYAGYKRK